MRTNRVSLCMIVKDEAENLPRCLEAARPYVDEICIVDTGSTDRTVEIAEEWGATVQRIAWPNSFAKARNVSLGMATGDWILVLDADEVMRPGQEEFFASIVDDPRNVGCFLEIVNHDEKGRELAVLVMRLFRNDPRFRFRLAIHEQVVEPVVDEADRSGRRVLNEGPVLDHYGYMADAMEAKNKDERNRRHFEQALEEDPDCAYLWFKYGDFLRRFDEPQPVIRALGRAVELVDAMSDVKVETQPYAAEAFALLALEHIREENLDEANRLLTRARARLRPTPMLLWVSGHLALRRNAWDEAIEHFEACRAYDGRTVHIPPQPGITNSRCHFGIARALLGQGKGKEGVRMIMEGAERWPDCEDLVLAATRIDILQGRHSLAIRRITRALERDPDCANFWQVGAELLLTVGKREDAQRWIATARTHANRLCAAAVTATEGECHLSFGRPEEALDCWRADLRHPLSRAGLRMLFRLGGEPLPPELAADDPEVDVAEEALTARLKMHPPAAPLLEALEPLQTV
ncbi:MAG TPA: glycosyltransferase [Planctomycetes bacterium]|nr:glycosyltransferase [Planctomycetota bacterium]